MVYELFGIYFWDYSVMINCFVVKLIGVGGGGYNDNVFIINVMIINCWVGV